MNNESLSFWIPPKLLSFIQKNKRYKIALGGRGGAKSMSIANMLCYAVAQMGAKVLCMREFQSSIDDSSFALIKNQIACIGIPGFKVSNKEIIHSSGGCFKFKGIARSKESIKSYYGFNIFFIEEAQFLSEESIRLLKPTLREESSEIWFALNPLSSEDPVSKEWLNLYWDTLLSQGYYEDDMHYIVMINYDDNAMFPEVLEQERKKDKESLPRALYDHIWLGHFNDSIEHSLIQREWFDACVDAHLKLGFQPSGIRYAAHDPADEGASSKGFAFRHGSVVLDVQEKTTGNINDGADWAIELAIRAGAEAFTWDCDGLGAGLNRQFNENLARAGIKVFQFRGSEGVDKPDAIFLSAEQNKDLGVGNQKSNKDALKNKRAQYYFGLRNKIYLTYRAIKFKEKYDFDKLISFSSKIKLLSKLRSQLCRIPIKENSNGKFGLYTKAEMNSKFKVSSLDLADSVMMLGKIPFLKPLALVNVTPSAPIGGAGLKNNVFRFKRN